MKDIETNQEISNEKGLDMSVEVAKSMARLVENHMVSVLNMASQVSEKKITEGDLMYSLYNIGLIPQLQNHPQESKFYIQKKEKKRSL